MLKAIVCVDKNYGIGKDGNLLYRYKEDMKLFKRKTKESIMIMGYNTYLGMPKKKETDTRVSWVLTHRPHENEPGTLFFDNIENVISQLVYDEEHTAWVCGGATIYEQLLPYCDELCMTRMNAEFEADTFFPMGNKDPNWKHWKLDRGYLLGLSDDGIAFRFESYKRISDYEGIDYDKYKGGVVDAES